ncbi:ABC transporter ATP-binding protein [Verminephrobacter eiseniae]|uniref:ABC transporter related n=1 Tax=Verminephrobacter eiseniae (strain EF01-2) TaxID=391735 RepID=A1WJF9_VEREI|nr:ABC transporter ATP-binding protein [Verminephrobacter eiseniae]ABM57766.1 ABC transporter related [Verminephrobacter eiseniae EF01-2]MCW5283378.1 ABC transporter ATP-binding protein [Verminephrobacter eiseniae]MCW5301087.1 ABC transporter ATP-binding protein [Verminephrobacter eiseniae]MCW8181940.1 ABC transporter ATP-binding protein [Verminephrobacter eiseniae]MCW8191075.1 ABC transporter ATP-binding protein [Verminephrobacter eiseniae]
MPHLSISGLCKAFGKKKLLDGLDLAVERGECLVVFGGSGSGKTTLLRHIAGLLEPDAGTVLIDGQRAGDVSAQQRGVAMAFQNFALYPHMTAFENIASPLRARAIDEARIARQVQEVAELLRIAHVLDHSPRQLSNGQKQRTSLARSLVHKPQMILLDDPLRNVDAKIRFEMRLEFPKLFKAFGSTVLYVTQDYREALALGDRIGVLVDGCFAQIDSPAGVYRNPQSREVARLFGDPPINLFEVTPQRGPGGAMQVQIGGQTLVLPDPCTGLQGRACVLGVRPEDLLFSTEAQPGALPVTMEAAMPINVRTVALLKAGDGAELLASRPEDPVLAARRERLGGFATLVPGRCMFFDRASGARI